MVHEETFKIALGVVIALLLGIGVGLAIYFFGKTNGGEMAVVSVQDEGGFPEAGERALKPYQYPQAKPQSYPQPTTSPPSTPSSPPLKTPSVKPIPKSVASPTKIVYPKDYQPYGDTSEAGYDTSKDSEAESN